MVCGVLVEDDSVGSNQRPTWLWLSWPGCESYYRLPTAPYQDTSFDTEKMTSRSIRIGPVPSRESHRIRARPNVQRRSLITCRMIQFGLHTTCPTRKLLHPWNLRSESHSPNAADTFSSSCRDITRIGSDVVERNHRLVAAQYLWIYWPHAMWMILVVIPDGLKIRVPFVRKYRQDWPFRQESYMEQVY